MADNVKGEFYGGAGCGNLFCNEQFFETLLMIVIIIWLLRWLFGFNGFLNY